MRFAQVELHQLRSSSTKANESAFIHIQSSHRGRPLSAYGLSFLIKAYFKFKLLTFLRSLNLLLLLCVYHLELPVMTADECNSIKKAH